MVFMRSIPEILTAWQPSTPPNPCENTMDHQGFSIRGEHRCDRAAAWRRINAQYFGELTVDGLAENDPEEGVDAGIEAYDVGPLRMLRISAPAHQVERRSRVEMPMDASYKLVLQLRGRSELRQEGSTLALHSGDWGFYDPRTPYSVRNFEPLDLLVVQVPHAQLRGFKVPGLHGGVATAGQETAQGMQAVLGTFLCSLAAQLPQLPNGVGQPLSETVLGLLASAMAARQGDALEYANLPGVLRTRVKQYVQANLPDADLSIERIAEVMRCSKRYLHRVFEGESLSIDRYIWQTRLERCHQEIGERAQARPMISQIAFSWGFNSSAHFCRMYKKHYGEAPSDYLRRMSALVH